MGRGDVGRGLAEAEVVIERTFRTQTVHQGILSRTPRLPGCVKTAV